ncbi:hypothetical protein CHLRE_08g371200v5 [Chlamydomonas reinhardtii]|uniref:Uncharacterized protein n=1 Tax=Chlamydomonas reinhardtii TaxID=3055 RepID=A0A2K3DH77_CHLRE|nr:uncharacterized protein CHLRE_08g371200v5 [Chlamydomonas reinhardtii]PNW79898.1 hypothetical protein CHLRE_08g371200v5 [Chlamydomonas reinhardtii]
MAGAAEAWPFVAQRSSSATASSTSKSPGSAGHERRAPYLGGPDGAGTGDGAEPPTSTAAAAASVGVGVGGGGPPPVVARLRFCKDAAVAAAAAAASPPAPPSARTAAAARRTAFVAAVTAAAGAHAFYDITLDLGSEIPDRQVAALLVEQEMEGRRHGYLSLLYGFKWQGRVYKRDGEEVSPLDLVFSGWSHALPRADALELVVAVLPPALCPCLANRHLRALQHSPADGRAASWRRRWRRRRGGGWAGGMRGDLAAAALAMARKAAAAKAAAAAAEAAKRDAEAY